MFSPEDKAKCSWFITTISVTKVQRHFKNAFDRDTSFTTHILHIGIRSHGNWKRIAQKVHTGRPTTSGKTIERVRAAGTAST